jgi:hypothetical protein
MDSRDLVTSAALLERYEQEAKLLTDEIEATRAKLSLLSDQLSVLEEKIDMTRRSRIPQLNQDTIDWIFEHVYPRSMTRYRRYDYTVMASYCLISTDWGRSALKALYRVIQLDAIAPEPFLATMTSTPTLCRFVKHIILPYYNDCPDFLDSAHLFPMATFDITLKRSTKRTDLERLAKVEELCIDDRVFNWTESEWDTALLLWTKLTSLKLYGVSQNFPRSSKFACEGRHFLPSLRGLSICRMGGRNPILPPTCPNTLTELNSINCDEVDAWPFVDLVRNHARSLTDLQLDHVRFINNGDAFVVDKVISLATNLERVTLEHTLDFMSPRILDIFGLHLRSLTIRRPSDSISFDDWLTFVRLRKEKGAAAMSRLCFWVEEGTPADYIAAASVLKECGTKVAWKDTVGRQVYRSPRDVVS